MNRLVAGVAGFADLLRLGVTTVLVALLLAATVPITVSLRPVLVLSGSMSPALRAGDVVLYRRVPATGLRPGQILVVDDPVRPRGLLTHRLVDVGPNGALHLKGDANASADSTPVDVADVRGAVRVRIPMIGLPALWWRLGQLRELAAVVLAGLLLAAAPALPRSRRTQPEGPGELGSSGEPAGDLRASP